MYEMKEFPPKIVPKTSANLIRRCMGSNCKNEICKYQNHGHLYTHNYYRSTCQMHVASLIVVAIKWRLEIQTATVSPAMFDVHDLSVNCRTVGMVATCQYFPQVHYFSPFPTLFFL